MNKTVTLKQLTYAAGLFVIGSNLLTRNLYAYTKNDTWLSIIAATAVSLVIVSLYGKLAKEHPGRNFFSINETVFGVVGGKLISALYVFYFLSLVVFNTRDLGRFVESVVLPQTPLNIVYFSFLVVCAYAVRKGADKMTQYGAVILFVYLALLLFNSGLLIPDMHPVNLLPVFSVPLKNIFLSTLIVTMLPYAEIFVFLMMAQHMKKPEETGKALRRGLMIGAATILFIVIRDIFVLGEYTLYTSSPTFNTIRLIDIGGILTRLEIINAVLQIIMLFFKISILLYALTVGVGQLFNIERYNIFTLILAVLTIICANFFFKMSGEDQQWFRTNAVYSTFYLFILPFATLIGSGLRKAAKSKKPDGPVKTE